MELVTREEQLIGHVETLIIHYCELYAAFCTAINNTTSTEPLMGLNTTGDMWELAEDDIEYIAKDVGIDLDKIGW